MWYKIKNGHTHNDHCQTSSNHNKENYCNEFFMGVTFKVQSPRQSVGGFFYAHSGLKTRKEGRYILIQHQSEKIRR